MKLTHELLTKLIEENDIEYSNMKIDDSSVTQLKCAYSIDTQSPADDDDKVISWLIENRERFSFYYTELIVDDSHYDWRETDDCLKIALHYSLSLHAESELSNFLATSPHGFYFEHENPTLAIMGCIAQLNEDQHAYAS